VSVLQLTPYATARIWYGGGAPSFTPTDSLRIEVDAALEAILKKPRIALEAFVPRGAMAQYGLLGVEFDSPRDSRLVVEAACSTGSQRRWADSLASPIDDVWLGLPLEYAQPTLDALAEAAKGRLPPGRLRVVEAAHGKVGSSPVFFRRLASCLVEIMLQPIGEAQVAELLRERLVRWA
jgi:hypothetical protein